METLKIFTQSELENANKNLARSLGEIFKNIDFSSIETRKIMTDKIINDDGSMECLILSSLLDNIKNSENRINDYKKNIEEYEEKNKKNKKIIEFIKKEGLASFIESNFNL